MDAKQFDYIVSSRFNKCKNALVSKSHEYASENDQLHNFKKAADIQGITPVEALRGMWAKHLVNVMDIIEQVSWGELPSDRVLDEKLGDTVNYALLLEGLIQELKAVEGAGGEGESKPGSIERVR